MKFISSRSWIATSNHGINKKNCFGNFIICRDHTQCEIIIDVTSDGGTKAKYFFNFDRRKLKFKHNAAMANVVHRAPPLST